jgi:hypothetical protein
MAGMGQKPIPKSGQGVTIFDHLPTICILKDSQGAEKSVVFPLYVCVFMISKKLTTHVGYVEVARMSEMCKV